MTDDAARTVELHHRFSARPETVFDAWLDPRYMTRWMLDPDAGQAAIDLDIDAREGGGFRFRFSEAGRTRSYAGEYLKIHRPHELEFTWRVDDEADASVVHVRFQPAGPGTRLTLQHRFASLAPDRAARVHAAWQGDFDRISATLGQYAAGRQQ